MKNNYGNYVVQKALKLSQGQMKAKLVNSIMKNIEKIGDKKLIMKWKSILNEHLVNINEYNSECSPSGVFNNVYNSSHLNMSTTTEGDFSSQTPSPYMKRSSGKSKTVYNDNFNLNKNEKRNSKFNY